MNIVIVGGGTSGWLTALYAKKIYHEHNIILIESEEYGILGAGEGSTIQFVNFLNFLEIPYTNLIKNCQATIKNGIKFTNWSNKDYFHPFLSSSSASNDYNFHLKDFYSENDTTFSHFCAFLKNHNLKDYSLVEKTSDLMLVPFIKNNKDEIINQFAAVSLHFDAKLLADYLKNIGEKRGIIKKEGIVNAIFNNKEGYINKLKTEKEEIECDFVFDCSGFKKLIIGNHYKSNWKSHSEYLPAKKAIPFFLKMDKKIPPYTEAIAMNYGWMWKIPLQQRYGCGYVFDSDYISDQEAEKEIEEYLGFKPEYPRKNKGAFSFSAGCFEEIWIKNCLSVGLSSGFIEPLEATSIMQTIFVLQRFMSDKQNLNTKNNFIKKRFNDIYLKETKEIVDFLYLHYVTNKKNSIFWQDFIKKNKMPEKISYILNICNDKPLVKTFDLFDNTLFDSVSYYYILIGNEIINKEKIKKVSDTIIDDVKKEDYQRILDQQKMLIPALLTHNDYIDIIKKQ